MSMVVGSTRIKLLETWLGHPKGSEIILQTNKANELVSRKVAKLIIDEEAKIVEVKRVGRPPSHKMMENYQNK